MTDSFMIYVCMYTLYSLSQDEIVPMHNTRNIAASKSLSCLWWIYYIPQTPTLNSFDQSEGSENINSENLLKDQAENKIIIMDIYNINYLTIAFGGKLLLKETGITLDNP